ncbi:MAG: MFS transporter [Acetobacteraceae bacterium]|nr:MFS transporter [Acetobacteraceae bacterium]
MRAAIAKVGTGAAATAAVTTFPVLFAISFSHLMNDMIQSLLPAIYPILKENYALDFSQVGLITLTFQITASLLQPMVGTYTDRRPLPYSLAAGMGATLCGLLLLAHAGHFWSLLAAAAMVGVGSSVFHPESSRVARLASGGRFGMAQSIFQVGGNVGSAVGPLLAAFVVIPHGQGSVSWFSAAALAAMLVLGAVGRWYASRLTGRRKASSVAPPSVIPGRRVVWTLAILVLLLFSKFFYVASLNTFYTFYLIETFGVSVQTSQLLLFLFLGAYAAGVLVGGPIGDRVGRKWVIWFSILGVLPFTLALPYASLWGTAALTVVIGLVLASASSAILVYAQELLPGRVGLVAGVFFGFAFGLGGLGAAVLGVLVDHTSLQFVYRLCAFLPALGLFAALLPDLRRARVA